MPRQSCSMQHRSPLRCLRRDPFAVFPRRLAPQCHGGLRGHNVACHACLRRKDGIHPVPGNQVGGDNTLFAIAHRKAAIRDHHQPGSGMVRGIPGHILHAVFLVAPQEQPQPVPGGNVQFLQRPQHIHHAHGGTLVVIRAPPNQIPIPYHRMIGLCQKPAVPRRHHVQVPPEGDFLPARAQRHRTAAVSVIFRHESIAPGHAQGRIQGLSAALSEGGFGAVLLVGHAGHGHQRASIPEQPVKMRVDPLFNPPADILIHIVSPSPQSLCQHHDTYPAACQDANAKERTPIWHPPFCKWLTCSEYA